MILLTPATFCEIGFALGGEHWHGWMARRMGVSKRTVERWATDDRAMPSDLWQRLDVLIDERAAILGSLRSHVCPWSRFATSGCETLEATA